MPDCCGLWALHAAGVSVDRVVPSFGHAVRDLNLAPHQSGPKQLGSKQNCSLDKAFAGQGRGGT